MALFTLLTGCLLMMSQSSSQTKLLLFLFLFVCLFFLFVYIFVCIIGIIWYHFFFYHLCILIKNKLLWVQERVLHKFWPDSKNSDASKQMGQETDQDGLPQ